MGDSSARDTINRVIKDGSDKHNYSDGSYVNADLIMSGKGKDSAFAISEGSSGLGFDKLLSGESGAFTGTYDNGKFSTPGHVDEKTKVVNQLGLKLHVA